MRENFSTQIHTFERYLGIRKEIRTEYKKWEELVEVFERRNLFAHSNGIIGKQYTSNMQKFDGHDKGKFPIGKELQVSPKYFSESLQNLFEFGATLILLSWRRSTKVDLSHIDTVLGDFCFDLIISQNYILASNLLEFSLHHANPKEDRQRRMSVVNLANCYRLREKTKQAEELLDREDWSATGDEFKLCVAAVKHNIDDLICLMEKLGKSDEMPPENYETWPVFYGVRDNDKFSETFERIYQRPYIPADRDRLDLLKILAAADSEANDFNGNS